MERLTLQPKETDSEDEYEKAMDLFDEHYWIPLNGAIPLCHEGCALRSWLVVAGPEAGNMWHDARAEYGGLLPISVGKRKRVTFLEWYSGWLDEAVAELSKYKG